MTGVNKKRLAIWGVIFIIFLGLGGGGFVLGRFMGYGTAGKTRTVVGPFIDRFNSLSQVKDINKDEKKSIKASFVDDGILVNYKNDRIKSDLVFNLKQEDNMEYLETTYNNNESNPETIVKLMIDAVGAQNGNIEGKIFDTFSYSDLMNTTLTEGVYIKPGNNGVKVQINLHANILANASNPNEDPSSSTTSYVLVEDYSKEFSSYATFTTPSKFASSSNGYVGSTDTNTCKAKFAVISPESAGNGTSGLALDVANTVAKGENTSTSTKAVNNINWNKVTYTNVTSGKETRYFADEGGVILMFEYSSMYANDECDEYEESILNSINVKE